jgi:uncharacterized protein (TIGR03437 family)
MVVSSNGGKDGILWETTGDRSQPGTPGTLHAFDASDLTQEIWNSETRPADSLGAFAKFATPLIANGRVYVPTFSNQLAIYGLTSSVTGPTPQITSLFNGASLIQGSVSPGEVVTILGNNIGPAAVQSLQLDTTGRVTTELAGTQVFFDGFAAPLLYTSSTEVGAVVPFGVTGSQTKLAVEYAGQRTAETAFPVSAATPALFSISGSGAGQGAILNQDGSVNSATNPAPPGSVVALFATGLGPTTPGGQDGAITTGVLPIPDLPVSVRIGDAPAEILYAGGAPQLIDGVFQINARIPKSTPSGTSTPIVLQVGEATSPNGVTLAVQ